MNYRGSDPLFYAAVFLLDYALSSYIAACRRLDWSYRSVYLSVCLTGAFDSMKDWMSREECEIQRGFSIEVLQNLLRMIDYLVDFSDTWTGI